MKNPDVFEIPHARWADFTKKFEKITKRARKTYSVTPSYEIVGETVKKMTLETPGGLKKVDANVRLITVNGPAPKYEGWEFVAKLDPVDGNANMINRVPSYEGDIPVEYRTRDLSCDHCKVKRYRKHVFVLKNETGDFIAVGRTCLGDFLGGNTPEMVARYCEFLLSLKTTADGYGGTFGGADELLPLDEVLEYASCHIRRDGWVSVRAARDDWSGGLTATAWGVSAHYSWEPKVRATVEDYKPTDFDREVAARTKAWVCGELAAKEDKNDYEHNLVTACADGLVGKRHFGIAVSAIAALNRVESKLERMKAEKDAAGKSEWVGEVGARVETTGKVTFTKWFDGRYGSTLLVKWRDADGNMWTWWKSGGAELHRGDTITVKATIKKYEDYKGEKSTVVTRGKVLRVENEAEYAIK